MNELNESQQRDQTIRALPCKVETSKTNLYIEGLPTSWDEAQLKQKFEQFGSIDNVKILTDKNSGVKTGVAFVHYTAGDGAQAALDATNNTVPEGETKPLAVRFAREQNKKKNQGGPRGGYNNYGGYGYGGYGPPGYGGGYGRGR